MIVLRIIFILPKIWYDKLVDKIRYYKGKKDINDSRTNKTFCFKIQKGERKLCEQEVKHRENGNN